MRGDFTEQIHALANHLRVQPHVRIHLIEIPHVGVADVMHLRMVLSWALGLWLSVTTGG